MFAEITQALVKSIESHPDASIGAVATILGTLLGTGGGFLLENLRNRGSVRVTPLAMHLRLEAGIPQPGQPRAPTLETARQIAFNFEVRFFNSFPAPQSVGLESIEFYYQRPGRFHSAEPLLSDPVLMMGTDFQYQNRDDVNVPPNTFTKLHLSGAAITEENDQAKKIELWKAIKGVQITFVLSRKKRLRFWHSFTEKELAAVGLAPIATTLGQT